MLSKAKHLAFLNCYEDEVLRLRLIRMTLHYSLSFENTVRRGPGQLKQDPSITSFQHGVLESTLTWMSPEAPCVLDAGNPCRHDGGGQRSG